MTPWQFGEKLHRDQTLGWHLPSSYMKHKIIFERIERTLHGEELVEVPVGLELLLGELEQVGIVVLDLVGLLH